MISLNEYYKKINRIIESMKLAKKQRKIDRLYEEEGLTDRVLEQQIELNKKRNELDIPDKTNFIYENFVQ